MSEPSRGDFQLFLDLSLSPHPKPNGKPKKKRPGIYNSNGEEEDDVGTALTTSIFRDLSYVLDWTNCQKCGRQILKICFISSTIRKLDETTPVFFVLEYLLMFLFLSLR